MEGAHNPENGTNPPRTDATHQENKDDAGVCTIPQDADGKVLPEDNASGTIVAQDDLGNETPLNYIQCKYVTSSGSGNFQSTDKCHVLIHAPSGWKLSDQYPSGFCTLSGNRTELILKFKPPPAVFDREILCDMMVSIGNNNTYINLPTGTLHSAVMAIMIAADERKTNSPHMIMKIPLLIKCKSVFAIEGLHDGRDVLANLVNAAIPAVS